MKKKRKNLGGMMGMMMMGQMGMGKPVPTPTPTPLNNPVILLNKFPPLVETSLETQTVTTLKMASSGRISLLRDLQAVGNQFAFIVNVVIYDPSSASETMSVSDAVTNSSGIKQNRFYNKAFQIGFGKDQNAYQHAMFYLSNVSPLSNNALLTVKHPPCQRRIVTVEQFVNLSANPLDQQTLMHSTNAGNIQITSGQTPPTLQPFELIYGSIAIGRDFDQFSEPEGFIPIQNVGSNIDSFDATLKTYYKLSAVQDKFGLSALVSSGGGAKPNFVWSAAVQTFKAIQL